MGRWLPLVLAWVIGIAACGTAPPPWSVAASVPATAPLDVTALADRRPPGDPVASADQRGFTDQRELSGRPAGAAEFGAPAARRASDFRGGGTGIRVSATDGTRTARVGVAPAAARPPPRSTSPVHASGSAARRPESRQAPAYAPQRSRAPYLPTDPPTTI